MLDFVGYQNKQFRWDHKLRALTGSTRRGLERDIEKGFPFLPSGCQIVLDKQAQAIVLDNVKSQIANRWPQIVAELKSYGDQDLATFLDESGLELSDVVREGDRSWTRLRREANLPTRDGSEREAKLLRRGRAFSHVDDSAAGSAVLGAASRRCSGVRPAHAGRAADRPHAALLAVARWRRL